jgi:N-acetylglucosaminyl-diphospho-decaprenol L-rhamnosyltransferase
LTPVSTAGLVVNFGTPELSNRAVHSLLADGVDEVVLVDNGSPDDSVPRLKAMFDLEPRVQLLALRSNVGFGQGVNVAARRASSEFLFVLNSDAHVRLGSTAILRNALADPKVGVAAPLVIDTDGRLQPDAWGHFPSLRTMITRKNRHPEEVDEPDWVSGVALMMRAADFRRLRGFDERFFMYYEDVDLCRRVRAHGFDVLRVRSAVVTHLHQGSKVRTAVFEAQYAQALDTYLMAAGRSRLYRRAIHVARQHRASRCRLRP